MIHSLAGGSFREKRVEDFALVEILDPAASGGKFWYLTGGIELSCGNKVLVPLKTKRVLGVVIRVDKARSQGQSPVPYNIAKEIIKKVEN